MWNPYFWAFACWALLITPVTVQVLVRLDHGVCWKTSVLIAGIPIVLGRKSRQEPGEETLEMGELLARACSPRGRVTVSLVHDGSLRRLMRVFRLKRLYVFCRLSFEDAAATAMGYSALRTVVQVLRCCSKSIPHVEGVLQADFHAQGSELSMEGIFSAHLGTVALAGIRLGISALRTYARLAVEEDQYAASH